MWTRDAADIAVEQLAFTDVQARTDLQPELGESVADRGGAADPASWAVEGGEEAVPGALYLPAAEALEFTAHDGVVALGELGTVWRLSRVLVARGVPA